MLMYGGLLAVGAVAYLVIGGGDSTPTKNVNKAPARSASKSTDTSGLLTDADYTASFGTMKITPKDAFLPLVTKDTPGGTPQNTGGLPMSLTGGEEWDYTGMVTNDGAPEAVLENPKSSESVFLTVGQKWKKAKVKRISDSDIELVGDDGNVAVVKMGEIASKGGSAESSLAPASVGNLSGPIGAGGVDINPLPGVQGQGFNPGRQGGRRRRNQSNNGGF